MTASASIKTPMTTLPLKKDVSKAAEDALCKEMSRLLLSNFMDRIEVTERLTNKVKKYFCIKY